MIGMAAEPVEYIMEVEQGRPKNPNSQWKHIGRSFEINLLCIFAVEALMLGIAVAIVVHTKMDAMEFDSSDESVQLEPTIVRLTSAFDTAKREILLAQQSVLLVHRQSSMFAQWPICQGAGCPTPTAEDDEFSLYSQGYPGMTAGESVSSKFGMLSSYLYLFNTQGIVDSMQVSITTSNESLTLFLPRRGNHPNIFCSSQTVWSVNYYQTGILICKQHSELSINITVGTWLKAADVESCVSFQQTTERLVMKAADGNQSIVYYKSKGCHSCPSDLPVQAQQYSYALDTDTSVRLLFELQTNTADQSNNNWVLALIVVFLIAARMTRKPIREWCGYYFGIINNIVNIMKTSLDDAFLGRGVTRRPVIFAHSTEIQNLADQLLSRTEQIVVPKRSCPASQKTTHFRLECRLKTLLDGLRDHLAPGVVDSVQGALNNREVLCGIKFYFQEQQKTFKELLVEASQQSSLDIFFSYAYNSLVMADVEQFKQFALENSSQTSGQVVNFFYYANLLLQTKEPDVFLSMGVAFLSSIVESCAVQLREIMILRIQNHLFGKYVVMIKEADPTREQLRRLDLTLRIGDLEQEIENVRYELAQRIEVYRRMGVNPID